MRVDKDLSKVLKTGKRLLRSQEPNCDCSICESIYLDKAFQRSSIKQAAVFTLAMLLLIIGSCHLAHAAEFKNSPAYTIEGHTIDRWTGAIGKAENNPNYGILSVSCHPGADCRRVCANTVRNNYKRWVKAGKRGTYLSFLANRYCPIGAANDPHGLNANWRRNVAYYLAKGE